MSAPIQPLNEIAKNHKATIVAIKAPDSLEKKLLEMGFVEGAHVMVLHEAPFTKDPIIIRLRNTRIALRRNEASHIFVQLEG